MRPITLNSLVTGREHCMPVHHGSLACIMLDFGVRYISLLTSESMPYRRPGQVARDVYRRQVRSNTSHIVILLRWSQQVLFAFGDLQSRKYIACEIRQWFTMESNLCSLVTEQFSEKTLTSNSASNQEAPCYPRVAVFTSIDREQP